MSASSASRYDPVPQPSSEDVDAADEGGGSDADESQPLVPNEHIDDPSHLSSRPFFTRLFAKPHTPTHPGPTTPASSDGVFTNIPAKPTSSREHKDEELGEDEWIFMSPQQREKLRPPRYSRVKRDRAPQYTTEYTPPQLPPQGVRKRTRPKLDPKINSLPAGSSTMFIITAFLCTVLPFIGILSVFVAGRRWGSHASRLGSRTGLGLGLIHIGAMVVYIPALVPGISAISPVPLIVFLVWTTFVGCPLGWRLCSNATREFIWLRTQEKVLCRNLGLPEPSRSVFAFEDGEESEEENGNMYIEGTDLRVRDLRRVLAKARDARLARSLRAAGF